MQTRARSSRRNKVNVRWLPVELIIEIFRAVQKLIGRKGFHRAGDGSMKLDQEYYNNLLAFALSSKEWTAIAQAELFRTIILKNRSKMGRFLDAVRGDEKFRGYSSAVTLLNFGSQDNDYETEGLGDDLDEIALYCPNIVEVCPYRADVRLEYFRDMKELKKLKISRGSVLPPSIPGAQSRPFTLCITLLSLFIVSFPSPLDASSLPLLRSLQLSYQTWQPLRQLLPQLASLRVAFMYPVADVNPFIQTSNSIASLSLNELDIAELDEASRTFIKEHIIEFTVIIMSIGTSSNSTLATINNGSKAMKKVILDGLELSVANQVAPRFLETLEVVKAAYKKKEIELCRENFKGGNGKVDLEK